MAKKKKPVVSWRGDGDELVTARFSTIQRKPGCDPCEVLLHDVRSDELLATLKGHSAQVYAFAVLQEPELAIVTAGLGGDAIVWERKLKGRRGYKLPAAKPGSGGWVRAAKLEGPYRTCGGNWSFRSIEILSGGGVALFDDLGTETFVFERVDGGPAWKRTATLNTERADEISKGCGHHNSHVKCHSLLPSGELVMGCSSGLVQVWERSAGDQIKWGVPLVCKWRNEWLGKVRDPNMRTCPEELVLRGHTGGVVCLVGLPHKQAFATGGLDNTVRVWIKSAQWSCVVKLADGPPNAVPTIDPYIQFLGGGIGVYDLELLSEAEDAPAKGKARQRSTGDGSSNHLVSRLGGSGVRVWPIPCLESLAIRPGSLPLEIRATHEVEDSAAPAGKPPSKKRRTK